MKNSFFGFNLSGLAMNSLLLEKLDSENNSLGYATGFFVLEDDATFLYTAWHCLTGCDPLDKASIYCDKRKKIKIYHKECQELQHGLQSIGKLSHIILDLYDINGFPKWIQEERTDLSKFSLPNDIVIPKLDIAKIPVELDNVTKHFLAIPKHNFRNPIKSVTKLPSGETRIDAENETGSNQLYVGKRVLIAGYPFGYNAAEDGSLEPVFITRFVSCTSHKSRFHFLLDADLCESMSGSPVFDETGKILLGIYAGSVYTDYSDRKKFSLGRVCDIYPFATYFDPSQFTKLVKNI